MIVNFSVQNFGSIKEKQTLSFEADSSTHLEDYYVTSIAGLRLLKIALIYGANASGKTTVLNALEFLRNMVVNPKSQKTASLEFEPFLFDTQTPDQNTNFEIEFVQNETRYLYQIEISSQCVVSEALYYYPQKVYIFKRTTNIEKQLTQIVFNPKISIDKQVSAILEGNTLWNNTVLSGVLKTNVDQAHLRNATDWFVKYLHSIVLPSTDLGFFISSNIVENKISKQFIIDVLKKADLNISDIVIKKEEHQIPAHVIEMLHQQAKNANEPISIIESRSTMTSIDLSFIHTVAGKSYELPYKKESDGTQRYYGLAGFLSTMVNLSAAFPIDELESSLHVDLFNHFLLAFLVNAKLSQIIATTHNRELLNDRDMFRNDAIWITEKSDTLATELYSLSDFDTSVIRDSSNILNAYKAGKLGGVPNLGDYYIFDTDAK